MSLLNDMLRDLSHTQKNAEVISVTALELERDEQRELLNQSSVIKPEPGKLWPSAAVFLCVLMVLWAWKQGIWQAKNEHAVDIVPAVADRSTVVQGDDLVEVAVPQEHTQVNTVPANVLQSTPSESVISPLQDNFDVVSPIAESADSAVVLNERLASLETAITKLSSVVEESQIKASDNIAIESTETENIAADNVPEDVSAVAAEQQTSVSIRDPFTSGQNLDQQQTQTNNRSAVVAAEKTIPTNAHLSVTPNPEFLDQRQAEQGRQLAAQGQPSDAIIALQAFIAKAQSPQESTRALLDIFVEQENIAAIETLLLQADYLNPLDKQFYSAKAAIIQQREDRAIELLEAQVTEAEEQESYRALLAGLYQRAGRYSEAASAYRRLLGSFGEKPSYWLGFALAQDSLSQRQTARQAYLRLAEYPDLQPEVRAYIQQRLVALQ